MYSRLNSVEISKHLTGVSKVKVTNRSTKPDDNPNLYTLHLSDHEPGSFEIELDIDKGYLYISNAGSSSVDFRLNDQPKLSHVQKGRKVALMPNESITLFIPYIDHHGESKSNQLKIYLGKDLDLLFELN